MIMHVSFSSTTCTLSAWAMSQQDTCCCDPLLRARSCRPGRRRTSRIEASNRPAPPRRRRRTTYVIDMATNKATLLGVAARTRSAWAPTRPDDERDPFDRPRLPRPPRTVFQQNQLQEPEIYRDSRQGLRRRSRRQEGRQRARRDVTAILCTLERKQAWTSSRRQDSPSTGTCRFDRGNEGRRRGRERGDDDELGHDEEAVEDDQEGDDAEFKGGHSQRSRRVERGPASLGRGRSGAPLPRPRTSPGAKRAEAR